ALIARRLGVDSFRADFAPLIEVVWSTKRFTRRTRLTARPAKTAVEPGRCRVVRHDAPGKCAGSLRIRSAFGARGIFDRLSVLKPPDFEHLAPARQFLESTISARARILPVPVPPLHPKRSESGLVRKR